MSGILMKFSTSEVTKFPRFKKKVERERSKMEVSANVKEVKEA